MVRLTSEGIQTAPKATSGDLFGGMGRVKAPPTSPAQAKKAFAIPSDLPTDWVPPEYRSIAGMKRIGLDIETHDPNLKELGSGAHRKDGKICGIALAYSETDASYYPTAHETGPNVENPDTFWERMRNEARDFEGEMVGTNLQYDLDWLRTEQGVIFPKAKFRDVQIAEPLLDENRLSYKLDILAKDHLNERKATDELQALYGGAYIENFHLVHPAHATTYGRGDVLLPWRIMDKQIKLLEDDGLFDLFKIESALFPLLLEMRYRGVRIDFEKAQESYDRLEQEENEIVDRLSNIAGVQVDIWSADSIGVAYDKLGLDYVRTSRGKPSFTKDWLNASDDELAPLIVKARANSKIKGTFIKSYILDSHVNGRLHCMFNQLKSDEGGTVSGRFSSSGPNLQNIPARDPVLGPLMRSMFIPEEGMLWGSLDWSQIEYRMLVHYAEVTKGIDASSAVRMYRNDPSTDFHSMASEITGVPRKQAKNVNFGVVYGMGVPKLAAGLGVSLEEAQDIMAMFQENAPFMRGMLDRCSNAASQRGFIRTVLGRKRRFNMWEVRVQGEKEPHFVSEDELDAFREGKRIRSERRAFTHKALNALLQGSAADLMKKAMVDAWEAGVYDIMVPHLTVHDELNQSVPDTPEGHEAFGELRHIMETTMELSIPIRADGTMGHNWDEAK
ncbi:DNA polymerase [Dinoroseobacter phage vB_DshS-R5C]|uniref:DNA polymerase n=1 Tax=Dinoroseobacter phage vB_DshS-R5C TaxID=1965368 RepID=A0A1V0DYE2_9CAUD|nr:DNA polymerase [Dinoroseobacter phage vB_DshS-R5C]ARB06150.1 putative DNA polymerase A [Dinoroseobacter phage vB_DshS-R5C]